MARRNFNSPSSKDQLNHDSQNAKSKEAEAAKDMNWMAQREKGKQANSLPFAHEAPASSPNKRKVTYTANRKGAKRQKRDPTPIEEGLESHPPKARSNGLARPSQIPRKNAHIKLSGGNIFDPPDDKSASPVSPSSIDGTPSGRSSPHDAQAGAIEEGVDDNNEIENHVDSTQHREDDVEQPTKVGNERRTRSGLKRIIPKKKTRKRNVKPMKKSITHIAPPSPVKSKRTQERAADTGRPDHAGNEKDGVPDSPAPEATMNDQTADNPYANDMIQPDHAEDRSDGNTDNPTPEETINDDNLDANETIHEVSRVHREDELEHTVEPELFGAKVAWAEMRRGAQKIGVSKAGNHSTRHLPNLVTPEIGKMVQIIKSVGMRYRALAHTADADEASTDELEGRIADKVADLCSAVEELKEKPGDSHEWNANAIQDIHAHAIRRAIPMLGHAMSVRSSLYSSSNDLDVIQEVIDLQALVLELCEKASRWKAKPKESKFPILNQFRTLIYPRLRDSVLPKFRKELDRRQKELRRASNLQGSDDIDGAEVDALDEDARRSEIIAESNRRLHQELDRNATILDIRRGYCKPLQDDRISQPRPSLAPPERPRSRLDPRDLWTEEEDVAFLRQLLDPKWTNPASRRHFDSMLTSKELQNKSSDMLEERARYFKDEIISNPLFRHVAENL